MARQRSRSSAKAKLIKWLREDGTKLADYGQGVSFETADSEVYAVVADQMFNIGLSAEDWFLWGANVAKDWWALSMSYDSGAQIEGEVIEPNLLTHSSSLIWESPEVSIYLRPGPPIIYWGDSKGMESTEYISPAAGGTVYVKFSGASSPERKSLALIELAKRRRSEFDSSLIQKGSQDRNSVLLLQEITDGVHTSLIQLFAQTLRKSLPILKAGVPSIRDVRSKLEMETKLRVEEGVTGSLRALAFTLEALEGAPDTSYPGLWRITSEFEEEFDIRAAFKLLLLWDSALYAVAAAVKFHGEFKSGLVHGKETSRTTYVDERRYSKRDAGDVESAYVQINPTRIVGNADAVVCRIINIATHELAHLATYTNIGHPESFQVKRENYLNLAADHYHVIKELVNLAGVDDTRFRPTAERPMSLEQLIAEEVALHGVDDTYLAHRWSSFRNISLNKALNEVRSEARKQEVLGRIEYGTSGLLKPI